MASGALTIRHHLGLAIVLCLTSATTGGVFAQRAASPDAVAIIQEFSDTGRTDYRFRSRDEALAFIKAWAAGVERWTAVGAPEQAQRRRRIAAVAAVELGRTAFDAISNTVSGGLHELLIDAAHGSLRQAPPDEFERQWLRATTGLLARSPAGSAGPPAHLEAAVTRFPRDPRLLLTRVLRDRDVVTLAREPGTPAADLAFSLGHGDRNRFQQKGPVDSGRADSLLAELVNDPEVGAEASARLGWLRFHQNRLEEGATLFGRALEVSREPFVRNLAALGLALTHRAAGRDVEARAAFRTAVAAIPSARAATTALAMDLFLGGDRVQASGLLDGLAGAANRLDPWKHVSGTDRFVDDILRGLRIDLGVPLRVVATTTPVATTSVAQASSAPTPTGVSMSIPEPETRTTRPLFSATTSIVSVDAAVMNGRRSVQGLNAADFEVRDNGVLQAIDSLSLEGLPLDITVVLDLRDAWYAAFGNRQSTIVDDATQQGVADTAQFNALLRPDDRLRIVTATRDVAEPHPLQGPGGRAIHRVPREVMVASALYDAIFTALARVTPPERRHLVLVFTDGPDGASIVTAKQLLAAAAKSDALVHVVRRDTFDEFAGRRDRPDDWTSASLLWPHDPLLLPALAEATSGSLERVNSTGQSVVADVKRTLESFRQRYILRYRPTGVEPGGWHNIAVRVNRPGNLTVQARRGYDGG